LRRFPAEFEDILSPKGRRLLAGASPLASALADPRRRFLAADGLFEPGKVEAGRLLLERHLLPHLARIDRPIPPESIWDMTENYAELLPKAMRLSTATFERRRGLAWAAAERIGLVAMLRSASYRAFAEAIAGRKLARGWGIQALCYGAGDYAGPHNDHHPELPEARRGYVDLHLTLTSPDVSEQFLVYAVAGHFTRIEPVARSGRLTAYRLPFWHYTTPLVARHGREAGARRWVLLGTFLYAGSSEPPAARTAAR
jgi:hypothetical protein